ncbi:unnamed protein product [Phytophthora lilii]|uniref:Unnamed protein product n=1 Tax=Phytophthora lilii TaxID=2077276 RepID=A0A9W6U8X2_9STRA|nr:unnamed protein product [Phytophthora lilii]
MGSGHGPSDDAMADDDVELEFVSVMGVLVPIEVTKGVSAAARRFAAGDASGDEDDPEEESEPIRDTKSQTREEDAIDVSKTFSSNATEENAERNVSMEEMHKTENKSNNPQQQGYKSVDVDQEIKQQKQSDEVNISTDKAPKPTSSNSELNVDIVSLGGQGEKCKRRQQEEANESNGIESPGVSKRLVKAKIEAGFNCLSKNQKLMKKHKLEKGRQLKEEQKVKKKQNQPGDPGLTASNQVKKVVQTKMKEQQLKMDNENHIVNTKKMKKKSVNAQVQTAFESPKEDQKEGASIPRTANTNSDVAGLDGAQNQSVKHKIRMNKKKYSEAKPSAENIVKPSSATAKAKRSLKRPRCANDEVLKQPTLIKQLKTTSATVTDRIHETWILESDGEALPDNKNLIVGGSKPSKVRALTNTAVQSKTDHLRVDDRRCAYPSCSQQALNTSRCTDHNGRSRFLVPDCTKSAKPGGAHGHGSRNARPKTPAMEISQPLVVVSETAAPMKRKTCGRKLKNIASSAAQVTRSESHWSSKKAAESTRTSFSKKTSAEVFMNNKTGVHKRPRLNSASTTTTKSVKRVRKPRRAAAKTESATTDPDETSIALRSGNRITRILKKHYAVGQGGIPEEDALQMALELSEIEY